LTILTANKAIQTFKFGVQSDAFQESISYEVSTILEAVKLMMEHYAFKDLDDVKLYDSNGNVTGSIKLL